MAKVKPAKMCINVCYIYMSADKRLKPPLMRSKSPICLLSFLMTARDQRPDDSVAVYCCTLKAHRGVISLPCYAQHMCTPAHADRCV